MRKFQSSKFKVQITALTIFSFFFLFVSSKSVSAAAYLYFYPSKGSYAVGSTASVTVGVNTGGQAVNAVSAYVNYPTDTFDVAWISGGSAITIWAEKSGGGGLVKLSGGTLSPITSQATIAVIGFKVKKTGTASLSFASGSHVVTQSGNSDILSLASSGGASYTLVSALPTGTPAPSVTEVPLPKILNIKVSNVDEKTVAVSWETNVETQGSVEYGVNQGQYTFTAAEKDFALRHSVRLTGLSAGTKFYYRIRVRDRLGREIFSAQQNFTLSSISGSTTISPTGSNRFPFFFYPWATGFATFLLAFFIALILISRWKDKRSGVSTTSQVMKPQPTTQPPPQVQPPQVQQSNSHQVENQEEDNPFKPAT